MSNAATISKMLKTADQIANAAFVLVKIAPLENPHTLKVKATADPNTILNTMKTTETAKTPMKL